MNVLITGISSGIGLETAKLLAQRNYQVFGTMRSPEKYGDLVRSLKVNYGENIKIIPMDVTSSDSVDKGIKLIFDQAETIDALVCNAGILVFGSIEDLPLELIEQQYNTNVLGALRTIKAVLPSMREKRAGKIILVSSLAGLLALPCSVNYSASKSAVDAVAEGLRQEVKQFGIKVSAVRPGDIKTRVNMNSTRITPDHSPYRAVAQKCWQIVEHSVNCGPPPRVVAEKIYQIIRKKNPKTYYTAANRMQALIPFLARVLTSRLKEKIVRIAFKMDTVGNNP